MRALRKSAEVATRHAPVSQFRFSQQDVGRFVLENVQSLIRIGKDSDVVAIPFKEVRNGSGEPARWRGLLPAQKRIFTGPRPARQNGSRPPSERPVAAGFEPLSLFAAC
jgi:hypothetical protein